MSPDCNLPYCSQPARIGIRTRRPTRDNLNITVYLNGRVAPKDAVAYCKRHGMDVIEGVYRLVEPDPTGVRPRAPKE